MDALKATDRCPKCKAAMKVKKDVLGDIECEVVGCMDCHQYGVVGDDRMFDRAELGDHELEVKLRKRAIRLQEQEHEKQARYTDVKQGRLWA